MSKGKHEGLNSYQQLKSESLTRTGQGVKTHPLVTCVTHFLRSPTIMTKSGVKSTWSTPFVIEG